MGSQFSPEEKVAAKTLAAILGGAPRANEYLKEAWGDGKAPSVRTIQVWSKDRNIGLDDDLAKQFSQKLHQTILGHVDDMLLPIKQKVVAAAEAKPNTEGQKSTDIYNLVRSYTFLANLILPANASGFGGVNIYGNVNTQNNNNVTLPFALAGGEEQQEVEAASVREVEDDDVGSDEPVPMGELPVGR